MWVLERTFQVSDFSGGSVSAVIPGCVGIWQNPLPSMKGYWRERYNCPFDRYRGVFRFYNLGGYSQGAIYDKADTFDMGGLFFVVRGGCSQRTDSAGAQRTVGSGEVTGARDRQCAAGKCRGGDRDGRIGLQ